MIKKWEIKYLQEESLKKSDQPAQTSQDEQIIFDKHKDFLRDFAAGRVNMQLSINNPTGDYAFSLSAWW